MPAFQDWVQSYGAGLKYPEVLDFTTIVGPPTAWQNTPVRDELTRVFSQTVQKLELFGSEVNDAVFPLHFVGLEVDFDVAQCEYSAARDAFMRRSTVRMQAINSSIPKAWVMY